MKVTPQEAILRQAWPLDMKIQWSCKIISAFVIFFKGKVYFSFSGGKDSRILMDIIDKIWNGTYRHLTPQWERVVSYPKPIPVFSNTGLEFPEIVEYVKQFFGVVIVKPKMGFTRVIKEIGVAVGTKKIAEMIRRTREYISNPSKKNNATLTLYTTGIRADGSKGASSSKLGKRWIDVVYNAPFSVSEKCCDILKKEPFDTYAKETGRKPIVGTRIGEGDRRSTSYYQTGCNSFDEGKERSRPLSIWTDADIWEYAYRWKIRFAEVYYDRIVNVEQIDGTYSTEFLEAETRTGCTFCMFGLHLEDKDKPNRIQRLALSHPKYYDIIINKCGLGDILSWLKLPYKKVDNPYGCKDIL